LEWVRREGDTNEDTKKVGEAITSVLGMKKELPKNADLGIDNPNVVNRAFESEGRVAMVDGQMVVARIVGAGGAVDVVREGPFGEKADQFRHSLKPVDVNAPIPQGISIRRV